MYKFIFVLYLIIKNIIKINLINLYIYKRANVALKGLVSSSHWNLPYSWVPRVNS